MEDFVTYEIAVKLKEKGFIEKCLFAYNDEQVINPKVVEEYGNLSDDGYYELTVDGGGKLKWDNVYIYEQKIILRDKIIIERNFIDAPTISQVLKWLRKEKQLHIAIDIWDRTWGYDIIKLTSGNSLHWIAYCKDIKSYEDAALNGIEYVIDNLI